MESNSADNTDIKTMTVKEFRKEGYLQEVNRLFFHPIGMALSVAVEENGEESFAEIWDYRDDPEGIIFDPIVIDYEFRVIARKFYEMTGNKWAARLAKLGFIIQDAGTGVVEHGIE